MHVAFLRHGPNILSTVSVPYVRAGAHLENRGCADELLDVHVLNTRELFSKVPIPAQNIHTIGPALADDLEELADAGLRVASAYKKELIREFAMKDSARFPIFDLVLLGPDGHTCSLFPGHALLSEEDRWVAYIEDSPKPSPRRITLTLPVLNHAARIAFVVSGEAKADVLHTILDELEKGLPASRVRPVNPGHLYWFTDEAAVVKVQYPRTPFKL
ncbi:nagb/rpia/CoA transferase-like protein [Trametes sanguinea]|nr:nagb/rpia/CoA transferase-like protein [Trametes sanguinea]